MQLIWDRKVRRGRTGKDRDFRIDPLTRPQTEGGFPELKVLKQRLRNVIQPEKDLGHSDVHPKASTDVTDPPRSVANGADHPLEKGQVVGSVPDIIPLQSVLSSWKGFTSDSCRL